MFICTQRLLTPRVFASILCHFHERTLKTAVIGSGPAGFYLTQYLIKNLPESRVDIYEKYPVPFGLVRFGVAPDHPEVKNVIHSFTTTAESNRVRFFGNVSIGSDVTLSELRSAYDAVVLCYGSSKDRSLGIPGEWEFQNVVSARSFVGWYNGVPSDKDLDIDLNVNTAVIIGHGNVALDVARILLTPVSPVLDKTDITSHAAKKLEKGSIKNVYIVGRRGPVQAAFTIKELREMTRIEKCRTLIDPDDLCFFNAEGVDKLPRARRRLTQLMIDVSTGFKGMTEEEEENEIRTCRIQFNKSPLAIELNPLEDDSSAKSEKSRVKDSSAEREKLSAKRDKLRVKFCKNSLENPLDEKSPCKPIEPAEMDEIDCGLVLKSIGYQTISLDPSIPMNERKGCIDNVGGRVNGHPGLYCSGWSATGPSGVLVNTMNVSFEVGRNILHDFKSGSLNRSFNLLNQNNLLNKDSILDLLKERNVDVVTFDDWKNIDAMELSLGERLGKPREKLVQIDDMVKAGKSKK